MVQVKRIGVLQTAKITAVMYFLISLVFLIPFGLIMMIAGSAQGGPGIAEAFFGGIFLIFMPIVYAVMGFVFVAIGCLFYNLVAKYVGGIEIELE
jgi:hypothetical protein